MKVGLERSMTLEYEQAVKALVERIDIVKQELLFAVAAAKHKPESITREIIAIKRELDKAVEERMKVLQVYSSPPSIFISS
jgi:hypothetical protein